ncbi:class I SAM-dependent methyltransferase [Demequina sp. SO4-13]|uniref:class I SAM-dependent methyltransferase n=1 Tax=Demequina sp. SO4-13 TaxID=3401027 RepID=UPI003AF53C95
MTTRTRSSRRQEDVLGRGPIARAWSKVFAAGYDSLNSGAEEGGVAELRAALLKRASGHVLEIGAGTGTNLPHYPAGLRSLTLTEPDLAMRRRLESRLDTAGAQHRVLPERAESLPLATDSVDTVVCTYVLCGVDLPAAFDEIRRVLRPGGQLLFLEHVRSPEPGLAKWQDRLNPLWSAVACGCNCNRMTEEAITAAGFTITDIERGGVQDEVALVRPIIWGRAV